MSQSQGFNFELKKCFRAMEYQNLYKESGRVKKVLGPIVEGYLPGAIVGSLCTVSLEMEKKIEAEIIGFRDRVALLMPVEFTDGIRMGARIEQTGKVPSVKVGPWMTGLLLNGNGEPVRELPEGFVAQPSELRPVKAPPLSPLMRKSIVDRLSTGIRAIDATIPVGVGQRIAIMAASGVGKSMLMGMLARQSTADVNVIALIGERGREVTEFLERDLGEEGLKKSIVIAVTSDESPVLKVRGAYLATAIAEYFRDQGKNCLLMMDSVTRFGMALREIGLSAGEPPTSKGYTPSVFSQLPKLLERAGTKKDAGAITALYTVLVEGNDFDDPIADAVRSIVDGHIVLSRELAAKSIYPSIDVLQSVSRVTGAICTDEEKSFNSKIREVLATYRSAEDLINIGGYRKGNNAEWDRAIELYPKIMKFLRQDPKEESNLQSALSDLREIFNG